MFINASGEQILCCFNIESVHICLLSGCQTLTSKAQFAVTKWIQSPSCSHHGKLCRLITISTATLQCESLEPYLYTFQMRGFFPISLKAVDFWFKRT